ncbi:hypothetical protein [Haliangium sp.]|uniref:hypothetical protein n=1 Tax=Haliangium sp. TaxID=2663208 RepID=UPI003D10E8F2
MNELLFPVVGVMVVFLLAVPALTLVARAVTASLPARGDGVAAQLRSWRFALIVGPTLAPVIWLVSAAVHQSEEGAPLACIVEHLGGDLCRDVAVFGLLVFSILGVGALRRLRWRGRPGPGVAGAAAIERVARVCAANPTLTRAATRIRVVRRGLAPACTRGLLRPRVEIDEALLERLDDDELAATLLHELEHAHALDPLRFFVAQVALSVNPLGRLLGAELARYHFAREALCDRRAVQRGADPLALARTIVAVATPGPTPAGTAALGGHGIGGVRVRVQLLLGYAARRPEPAQRSLAAGVATSLLMLLAASPHVVGTGPLDSLHRTIERAALVLGVG